MLLRKVKSTSSSQLSKSRGPSRDRDKTDATEATALLSREETVTVPSREEIVTVPSKEETALSVTAIVPLSCASEHTRL